MCDFGSTYRCNHPPRHIWIIISRPSDNHGQFLFVNLTTYNNKCIDDTCLLDPCDYQFLTHRTTVAYSRGHIGNVLGLGLLVEAGNFSPMPRVPDATLAKIVAGARRSPQLSATKKGLLPKE
jgi:hypothetical protein